MNKIAATRADVAQILESVPMDFGGGCSVSKATVMAYLIRTEKIRASIDLGVYRGRSFFPQALMHTKFTGGTAYGIDPYTAADASETDNKELQTEIDAFVAETDFDGLYQNLMRDRKDLGVEAGSEVLRMTSDDAVAKLSGRTFGLIHIDGNHDTAPVIKDVNNYIPMLDPTNGFLVLDDISWRSVRPAVDIASAQLTLLYARVDSANDYAVFWNGTSARKKSRLRKNIGLAGEN